MTEKIRTPRRNTMASIIRVAGELDTQGRPEQPIAVNGSRSYLIKAFKPRERSGPLYCGDHPLVLPKTVESSVHALEAMLQVERAENRINTAEHNQRHLERPRSWLHNLFLRTVGRS